MRPKSTVVLGALLATLALSAGMSATASAAPKPPEFKSSSETCIGVVKAKTGRYTNSTCTIESGSHEGEFNFVPAKRKFTGSSGVSTFFAPGVTVTCKKAKSKGEITGERTLGSVAMTFEECEAENTVDQIKCQIYSQGKELGTVETAPLAGELGVTTVGTKIGEALKSEKENASKEFVFTEIASSSHNQCIPTTKIRGSIIGEVAPIGTPKTEGKLTFEPEAAKSTKQKIKVCSGGNVFILCNETSDILNAFGGTISLESTDAVVFGEAIEVT
jgi:hypothetical protein